jgi:Ca2+/Na+ antiporter
MEWTLVMGVVAVLIVVLGIFAILKIRKQKEIRAQYPGYPKGYWMSQGVGIGIAIGAGIGAAMNDVAVGIAIGVAIGAGIGSQLEKKHADEIRPMTDEEQKLKRQSIFFTIGTLFMGMVVFAITYFVAK